MNLTPKLHGDLPCQKQHNQQDQNTLVVDNPETAQWLKEQGYTKNCHFKNTICSIPEK